MIAEYWADGPRSETPAGPLEPVRTARARAPAHRVARARSRQAVKLLFALKNAIFDAGCCAWDAKVTYDSVRPITSVRWLFRGTQIQAWAGPGQGTQSIAGETWFPYQPTTFPTPPFGSTARGTAPSAPLPPRSCGCSPTAIASVSRSRPGRELADRTGVTPHEDVTLSWPTFSDAAAEAGVSRRYGGIHFLQGDLDGRVTGRIVAQRCWPVVLAHVNGSANAPK